MSFRGEDNTSDQYTTAGNLNSKAWRANSSDRLGPYDRVIMSRFFWEYCEARVDTRCVSYSPKSLRRK